MLSIYTQLKKLFYSKRFRIQSFVLKSDIFKTIKDTDLGHVLLNLSDQIPYDTNIQYRLFLSVKQKSGQNFSQAKEHKHAKESFTDVCFCGVFLILNSKITSREIAVHFRNTCVICYI